MAARGGAVNCARRAGARGYLRGMNSAEILQRRPEGLYCAAGDFFIDPARPVARAIVTHGHADHCRPGSKALLATPQTLRIAEARYGANAFAATQALDYGATLTIGDARVRLAPAGHVLGSAQVVVEVGGRRAVVSGDYKRRADPTCAPFEPVTCDLFVTEATFGLPVFRHPPAGDEIAKLLRAREQFPDRAIVVGAYALGKAQRLIKELRLAGYTAPIHLHGALLPLCRLYQDHGVDLGALEPATAGERGKARADLKGQIVLAPPSAIADRWARRLPEPLIAMASGWMRVKQRARQRGVELPLILSDHADWDELLATIEATGAGEIWVTHGREEALVHACAKRGIAARALALVGYEEDG
jgi:putative mRNA 3-end processing factor